MFTDSGVEVLELLGVAPLFVFVSWIENPPSILGYTVTHSNNVQMEKRIYEVPCTLSSHHRPENCTRMLCIIKESCTIILCIIIIFSHL